MKYLGLLRKPKSLVLLLVLLVHPIFRPRWVDAIDRGLMRLFRAKPYRPFQQKTAVTQRLAWTNMKAQGSGWNVSFWFALSSPLLGIVAAAIFLSMIEEAMSMISI